MTKASGADGTDPPGPLPEGLAGRLLGRICELAAMLGSLMLVGIVIVSSASIIGRSVPHLPGPLGAAIPISGIPGDVELVQLGCAVAVFCCLPLCQLQRANVLVGAFTKALPVRWRAGLDLAANLLFFVITLAVATQIGQGMTEKFRNHDTTMVLRIPEGWAYVPAVLACWLLVLVTAYTVLRSAREIRMNRPIGPSPPGGH